MNPQQAPTYLPPADAVLVFDTPSFRNFSLWQRGVEGRPQYIVRTTTEDSSRVEICDGARSPVVLIEYKMFLPDQITFAGHNPLPLSWWLKPHNVFPTTFEWQGGKYSWRLERANRLTLYYDSATPAAPIAWYESARMASNRSGQPVLVSPSHLSLRGVATEPTVRNAIIASFLIVVHRSGMSAQ